MIIRIPLQDVLIRFCLGFLYSYLIQYILGAL